MKNFVVKVNGNVYNVEVEEATGVTNAPISAAKTEAPAAAPVPTAVPAGANAVTAPMPGNILDIKVSAGQSVKSGEVLVILEAMKMENEILAPCDGTISAVNTTKGSTVNTGDVLVTIG